MSKLLLAFIIFVSFKQAPAQAQTLVNLANDVGSVVNDIRAGNGLPAIVVDKALVSAARSHAQDMDRGRFVSHVGSDGTQVAERARAAGFCFRYVNENIAKGFRELDQVMSAWMSSSGHRNNILAARATHFGFANINRSWVLVLGAPC